MTAAFDSEDLFSAEHAKYERYFVMLKRFYN